MGEYGYTTVQTVDFRDMAPMVVTDAEEEWMARHTNEWLEFQQERANRVQSR